MIIFHYSHVESEDKTWQTCVKSAHFLWLTCEKGYFLQSDVFSWHTDKPTPWASALYIDHDHNHTNHAHHDHDDPLLLTSSWSSSWPPTSSWSSDRVSRNSFSGQQIFALEKTFEQTKWVIILEIRNNQWFPQKNTWMYLKWKWYKQKQKGQSESLDSSHYFSIISESSPK